MFNSPLSPVNLFDRINQIHREIEIRDINKYLRESYLSIYFVGLLTLIIGIINLLINHSKDSFSFTPILLFIMPSFYYFILANQSKKFIRNPHIYFFTIVLYLFLCYIEFKLEYSLEKIVNVFAPKQNSAHPISYVLQILPISYKIFKIGLVLVFARIWFKINKLKKLSL